VQRDVEAAACWRGRMSRRELGKGREARIHA